MKIINDDYLATGRGPGRCELCGKSCQRREAHHVVAKGMGGGRRLDVPINIVFVGSTPDFQCRCHTDIDTQDGQQWCREVIAARERTTPEAIEEAVDFILRLDKDASKDRIKKTVVRTVADAEVARLITKTLVDAGKL